MDRLTMKEIYQILAGALGHETRMAQIANNLANVNTTAYKQDRAVFLNYMDAAVAANGGQSPAEGSGGAANPADPVWPTLGDAFVDMTGGPLQPTSRPLDLAIEGEGLFMVEVEGESDPLFTRAGNFKINNDGALATSGGHLVLDPSGRSIQLEFNGVPPEITEEGEILLGGESVGRIGVVTFETSVRLEKFGEGLLRPPTGTATQPVEGLRLRQGMLEGSNVNAIDEMVRMIRTQRAYDSMQKAVQSISEITSQRIDAS
jgi:flagellar basal-body rod protein FlgF